MISPCTVIMHLLERLEKGSVGVEVGVLGGKNLKNLCDSLPNFSKFYGIDPWIDFTDRKWYHKNKASAERNLEGEINRGRVELIEGFSADEVAQFNDNSLDFVFIDGNHEYEFVKEDIGLWRPKVKKGGILAGDDYKDGEQGVVKAVDEIEGFEIHGEDVWVKRIL